MIHFQFSTLQKNLQKKTMRLEIVVLIGIKKIGWIQGDERTMRKCSTNKNKINAIVDENIHPSDNLDLRSKASYAFGGTIDSFGRWLYSGLANQVYVTYFKLAPSSLSIALFFSCLVEAFTDPLFGWLSDNARSKWGRRRPFILFGSLVAGIALPTLFMASRAWGKDVVFLYMLISSCLYMPLISACNMPYQSLGAEMTPDYNERTSVMSWKAVVQTIALMLVSWSWWFASRPIFNDPKTGQPNLAKGAVWAATIAGSIMILAGFTCFYFTRERYYQKAQVQNKVSFAKMMKQTFRCKPNLILLSTVLLFSIPTALFNNLGFYIQTYYVFGGDAVAASTINGWSGVSFGVFSLLGIPVAAALSAKLGKRDSLKYIFLCCAGVFLLSYWLYTPTIPWLCTICSGLYGINATGVWVILPSMSADVIDYDELSTHERREGAFSASFSWVLKVGMALSMLIVGPILGMAGFDSHINVQSAGTIQIIRLLFAGLPFIACIMALVVVTLFPLTQEQMIKIRCELEKRRGEV
jgi:GPH family glycoside/pentoside/hexuronide:cation symporter